jgi:hypothetical protein
VKITQLVEIRRMSHVQYQSKVEVRPTPRISAGFNSTGGICVICTSLGGVGLSTCAFLPVTHVTSKLVNYVIFTNKFLIMTSWIIILVTAFFSPMTTSFSSNFWDRIMLEKLNIFLRTTTLYSRWYRAIDVLSIV